MTMCNMKKLPGSIELDESVYDGSETKAEVTTQTPPPP